MTDNSPVPSVPAGCICNEGFGMNLSCPVHSPSPVLPNERRERKWTCSNCGKEATYDERGWLQCPCDCATGGTFTDSPRSAALSVDPDIEKMLDEYAVIAVRASRGRATSADLSAARSALQAAFLKLLEERDAAISGLLNQIMDFENREAKVCPEDFGFEEYIASLEGQVAALREDALTPEEAENVAGWCLSAKNASPTITMLYKKCRRIAARSVSTPKEG